MTYLIAGGVVLLASFLFAMLGMGGGMVYVPLFHWIGFDLKTEAIPLGLLLNGLTTLLALIAYSRKRLVDWKGAWPMGLAATLGAPVGALSEPYVPKDMLLIFFALAVLLAALRMAWTSRRQEPESLMPLGRRVLISSVLGVGIGFIAGMLGIGGGFIVAPLLMWMGYPTKQAAATTSLVAAFSSFSGFAGHVAQGHFPLTITLIAVVAILVGALSGARFMADKAKPKWVKQSYAVILVLIALKLLWEAGSAFIA